MATAPLAKTESTAPATLTISEKFVQKIEKQFIAEMGTPVAWTPLQKTLAQHLYVKIDSALRALEVKRAGNRKKANDPVIAWENVDMSHLTEVAVNRIHLELDALIPNHIHVIPYLNKRTQKYEVDLRIGYVGIDHTRRKFAIDIPLDIEYQLVYEGDKFGIDNSAGWQRPIYEPKDYFNPGPVKGGYGYVTYQDPRKNRVIPIPFREFEKAMKASGGVEFWGGNQTVWVDNRPTEGEFDEKFRQEMQYKTIVFRVCNKIPLDTAKVNTVAMAAISDAMMDATFVALDDEETLHANGSALEANATPSAAAQEDEDIREGEFTEETTAPNPAPQEPGF